MTDQLPEKLLLTARETAHMLSVSESTLEAWRAQGKGPPWIRFPGEKGGRGVRYPLDQLKDWITKQTSKDKDEGAK